MKLTYEFSEIQPADRAAVGGKAFVVAELYRRGYAVPLGVCISTEAYERFVNETGLRGHIQMEYGRKAIEKMRWEEMWDVALRIQHKFLRTEMPGDLAGEVVPAIRRALSGRAVAVRSSAPAEDGERASFAGLHASYVNIRGVESILKHIRLVWASLWSHAAILYRREIGLDIASSSMAVLVQQVVAGDVSGVVFTQSPQHHSQGLVEAVYGLNQGLVDGAVEPDRWVTSRSSGRVLQHHAAARKICIAASSTGTREVSLSGGQAAEAPLDEQGVLRVWKQARQCEDIFERPQDVEWTVRDEQLYLLQSRPVTTRAASDPKDKRSWYMSLTRSLPELRRLKEQIAGRLLPEMERYGERLAGISPGDLTDEKLAAEIGKRQRAFDKFRQAYWKLCIPFAHAVRLFGEVYNRMCAPGEPYEFTQLLASTPMVSIRRNRRLTAMARFLEKHPDVGRRLERDAGAKTGAFDEKIAEFLADFENVAWGISRGDEDRRRLVRLVVAMSHGRREASKAGGKEGLREQFISAFPRAQQSEAKELLELARVSYQLRDDDNIYLGRIESELQRALAESRRRIGKRLPGGRDFMNTEEAILALKDPAYQPRSETAGRASRKYRVRPRQLIGQAAGQGIATGTARVVSGREDIFDFEQGEVLVCDAIDPNMTFVVPLACAIVERRGGMLIHGAIIAREYGLPCVTGIPDAAQLIQTGMTVTVDGYLGIVTVASDD